MIQISNKVYAYFEKLVHTLIDKGYFSYQHQAENYVLDLKRFITSIDN